MYECNWCWKKQVKDDGSCKRVQNGDRMAFKLVGKCAWNCRSYKKGFTPIMHPMYKDGSGDWHREFDNKKRYEFRENEIKVVAQATWH